MIQYILISSSYWPGLHTLQQGFWPTPPDRSSPDRQVLGLSFCSLHRVSMGLRSGDWLGHSRTLKCFLRSHSLVALAVCLGSLSCWKTQLGAIFYSLTEGRRLLAKIIAIHRPVPFAEKHPQSMMFPPHSSRLGCVLGFLLILLLPPNTASGVYILVSSDHMTFSHASSGSSRWYLANFRRAWTCAVLSRETLRTLQDVNSWRCSVLLISSGHWPGPPVQF